MFARSVSDHLIRMDVTQTNPTIVGLFSQILRPDQLIQLYPRHVLVEEVNVVGFPAIWIRSHSFSYDVYQYQNHQ
jgi:hypothetical protein